MHQGDVDTLIRPARGFPSFTDKNPCAHLWWYMQWCWHKSVCNLYRVRCLLYKKAKLHAVTSFFTVLCTRTSSNRLPGTGSYWRCLSTQMRDSPKKINDKNEDMYLQVLVQVPSTRTRRRQSFWNSNNENTSRCDKKQYFRNIYYSSGKSKYYEWWYKETTTILWQNPIILDYYNIHFFENFELFLLVKNIVGQVVDTVGAHEWMR
jgi:hypothetical protein